LLIKPINLPNRNKVSVEMEEVTSGHMTGGVGAAQNAAEKAAKRGKEMFPDWTTPAQAELVILDAYTFQNNKNARRKSIFERRH